MTLRFLHVQSDLFCSPAVAQVNWTHECMFNDQSPVPVAAVNVCARSLCKLYAMNYDLALNEVLFSLISYESLFPVCPSIRDSRLISPQVLLSRAKKVPNALEEMHKNHKHFVFHCDLEAEVAKNDEFLYLGLGMRLSHIQESEECHVSIFV